MISNLEKPKFPHQIGTLEQFSFVFGTAVKWEKLWNYDIYFERYSTSLKVKAPFSMDRFNALKTVSDCWSKSCGTFVRQFECGPQFFSLVA